MEEDKENLSEREIEILRLVATGAANKEIARQLVISPNTVKVHLRNIFTKIGVASRTEATLYAINIGLVNTFPEPTQEPFTEAMELPIDEKQQSITRGEPIIDFSTVKQRRFSRYLQISLGLLLVIALITGILWANQILSQTYESPTTSNMTQSGDPSAPRWSSKASMPTPRKGMGFISYNDNFYLIGGETNRGVDGALLLYDPKNDTWKTLKNKPTPVTDVRAALLGEKIYVPGGQLKDGTTTTVLEVYDPRHNSWEKKASMPVPLSAYTLAAFEGKLFLFGGKNGNIYASTVYSYNPEEDRWEERSPLGEPRAYAGSAVLNNKILIIGGFDGQQALQSTQAYFPNRDAINENAWEEFQPLPGERYAMGVAQLGDFIFVFGGYDGKNNIATRAFQYTVPTNQWAEVTYPPAGAGANPAMLASGNHIFICGGEFSSGLIATNQAYQAIYTISVPIIGN